MGSVNIRLICAVWALVLYPGAVYGNDRWPAALTDLSLEALMDIEVTSVARKSQKISSSAAAVFVITHEDIRRSGATSLPEALRMVPGLQVARLDSNKWAISARGFNGRFANKLLVMIDGRTVYSPLFSGTFWEIQDTVLDDVDRIEIIRGPGGSLWGENAVNGVINVITKSAKETHGGLLSTGVGTEERGFGTLRYGGAVGSDMHYRAYGKYFNRDTGFNRDEAHDDWRIGRGGFRADWEIGAQNTLTVQGDYYNGDVGQQLTLPTLTPPTFSRSINQDIEWSGGNFMARWEHQFDASSDMAVLLYYDRTAFDGELGAEQRDTVDLDFQSRFPLGSRQEILWGLEYRLTSDSIRSSPAFSLDPGRRDIQLFSGFFQDEIQVIEDRLMFAIGSKFTHNEFTGFEHQPSARLLWTPTPRQSVWAAASRAVRTPSRIEDDGRLAIAGTPFGLVRLHGNPDLKAETLLAYELGYRTYPTHQLSLDVSTFFNVYDDLTTVIERVGPQDFRLANTSRAETYGVELAADWRMRDWWRVRSVFSYLHIQLHHDDEAASLPRVVPLNPVVGENPDHTLSLLSFLDVTDRLTLNAGVRFVDALPSFAIPSYWALDLHLAWAPRDHLELSIVGQNVLDSHHPEFGPQLIFTQPTEVQRSVYLLTRWQF